MHTALRQPTVSGTPGHAFSPGASQALSLAARLDLTGQYKLLAGAAASEAKHFVASALVAYAHGVVPAASMPAAEQALLPDLQRIALRASRKLNALWAHCGGERSTFSNLRLFVDACEHLLPRIADVRSFEQPAVHELYAMVESSTLFDASHDLRAAARQYGYGGEGEPKLIASLLTQGLVDDEALMAANVVLALSAYPVDRLPEIIGFTRAMCGAAAAMSARQAHARIYRSARTAADRAVRALQMPEDPAAANALADRVRLGAHLFDHCAGWLLEATRETDAKVRDRAKAVLEGKAGYAMLHHRDQSLGGRRLIEWFSDATFRSGDMLEALSASPWIDSAEVDNSRFFTGLLAPGGRMYGIFSDKEVAALKAYFRMPAQRRSRPAAHSVDAAFGASLAAHHDAALFIDEKAQRRFADLRQSYHVLVNAEHYPFALVTAADTVQKNLAKFEALRTAIESQALYQRFDYSAQAFGDRISGIYYLHAEQNAAQDLHFDAAALRLLHLYFSPFALVDGCWLRNVSAQRNHTEVTSILTRIFADEIGNSRHEHNHANVYRGLLRELGWDLPPVDALAYATDERIPSAAFKAPSFLLAMNLLHADYFPELLGVNLAIEMSGLDGFYAEMIRDLEALGHTADFWRLHISVDNFSTGHAKQSVVAIMCHLDDVAQAHGQPVMQLTWQRVWNGLMTMLYLFGIEFRVLFGARKNAAQ